MFIVSPPEEVEQAIQEQLLDDAEVDMGSLDADFLEFDELEKTYDDYAGGEIYTRLDYDALGADLLVDLLDEVEELVRTMGDLEDMQDGRGTGPIRLVGAKWGMNKDSQYAVFEEDDGIVFYRDVNGVIALNFLTGGSIRLDTEVDGYAGIITADGGDDILVVIRQSN